MQILRKHVNRLLFIWPDPKRRLAAALATLADHASAQEQLRKEQSEAELEEVQVTGTRIKRTDLEAASPVAVIDRAELEATGAADVGEIMRRLPAVSGSPASGRAGGFNSGMATVDLRGIGANNTLVLINGRRAVPRGIGGAVDLSSIPMEAVERVEVLKDGASAIYGSDATAGVVNVITRNSYDGLSLNVEGGESKYGDAANQRMALTWGGEFDTSSIVASLSRRSEDGYFRHDREISKDADLRRFGDFGANYRSGRSPATRIRALPGEAPLIDSMMGVAPGGMLASGT